MSREEGGAPDSGGQGVTLNRLIALIAGSTSAALGVLKLVGGTMSGAIAMGSQKITGLAMGDTAGDALRFEALGPGTRPTLTGATTETPTGWTLINASATEEGVSQQWASSTATSRTGGIWWAGKRVAARIERGYCVSAPSGSIGTSGQCLRLKRADGKIATAFRSGAVWTIYYWTDKDTLVTARLLAGLNAADDHATYVRFGQASAGANIVLELSTDGVTYNPIYSATPTTVFADSGDVTSVGEGLTLANATAFAGNITLRHTVDA